MAIYGYSLIYSIKIGCAVMKKNKNWWKNKIAYQIYPRSFYDANGDGTGDIKGITAKLDYLKELGIDIVWMSPVYRSPMDDGGYDISDYYDIDPIFGNKADMDELIEEANKRGIKILMDLVLNHCSDEHEWFQKALADPESEEAGYFYFRNSKNGPPNNWRSMFGGSAWENVGGDRYYLHLFSKKQPDLNWENPRLRSKLYEMINYWLDKGLGGFRIDAITHIKKEPTLSSLPPDGKDGLVGCFAPTRNYPGIGDFLTELRQKTFDNYECMTVAEAAGVPYDQLGDYIGENGYFDTLFDFTYSELYSYGHGWHTFKKAGEWPITLLRDKMFASQIETAKVGFGAVYFENHDYPRAMTKFIPDQYHSPTAQKMLGNLFFFLKGIPFIYQGQEIGMTNVCMDSIDDYNDISTKNNYKIALADGLSEKEALKAVARYSRDNGRVPFSWKNVPNAGFTTGKPWLKVHPDYPKVNAEDEMKDPDSVYSFYKKMICIRKSGEHGQTLTYGSIKPILTEYDKVIAYERSGDKNICVICSFDHNEQTISVPFDLEKVLLNNYSKINIKDGKLTLLPYQSISAEI